MGRRRSWMKSSSLTRRSARSRARGQPADARLAGRGVAWARRLPRSPGLRRPLWTGPARGRTARAAGGGRHPAACGAAQPPSTPRESPRGDRAPGRRPASGAGLSRCRRSDGGRRCARATSRSAKRVRPADWAGALGSIRAGPGGRVGRLRSRRAPPARLGPARADHDPDWPGAGRDRRWRLRRQAASGANARRQRGDRADGGDGGRGRSRAPNHRVAGPALRSALHCSKTLGDAAKAAARRELLSPASARP